MEIYTMGFTKKNAEQFFELIKENQIDLLIDVRLNNSSQLAGFTKGKDLSYFLDKLCGCRYAHEELFGPTKDILNDYKKNIITWDEYVLRYNALVERRNIKFVYEKKYFEYNKVLLLCSEVTAEKCHRRLLAEYLQNKLNCKLTHI